MQMRRSAAARFGDGLHGIVHEIETTCCSWMRSPKIGGQRIGDVELDGDPVGRGVRLGEHQRIIQHRHDVERAEVRLAAAQEFAHAPHDAAGVVDLGDKAVRLASARCNIGLWRAQDLLG